MTEGYLYCFSNNCMPGILKIGMTERTPEDRLQEANSSDTWRPPIPYKIEFAKKVNYPKQKESKLHLLLSQYTERIHPKREFFRVSPEEVKAFFDLIDGVLWTCVGEEEEEEELEEFVKGCRDMKKCFSHGQRVRHIIGITKIWNGIYDSNKNGIICGKKFYKSLSGFSNAHYSEDRSYTVKSTNGWKECECFLNEKWISTYNL